MLYDYTLDEIAYNINTGVEYEIALFYCLSTNLVEKNKIMQAIGMRGDAIKIRGIINRTSTYQIQAILNGRGQKLIDVSFETQNDDVGPSDIVMLVEDNNGNKSKIGLSVKYSNNCTLNVTGKRFLTTSQIDELKQKLEEYTSQYICEMEEAHGAVDNWFRKRKPSKTTDQFIDLIRQAVIDNWDNIPDKAQLLEDLYHSNSPIEYWVFKYTARSYEINEHPYHLKPQLVDEVEVRRMGTSYIAFYVGEKRIGHMQVKFNNGFVERCKKSSPDFVVEETEMCYGKPFFSWNFSIEN